MLYPPNVRWGDFFNQNNLLQSKQDMSIQETKINKLQKSIDEIKGDVDEIKGDINEIRIELKSFATKDELKKEFERFATKDDLKDLEFNLRYEMRNFVTKDEMIGFKDEILTAIDAIAIRHITFEQELLMQRSQYLRHEDRLEVIENKLDI